MKEPSNRSLSVLVGKARRLRIWERRARRWEAHANNDWSVVARSFVSEWAMGYGVSIGRISMTIIVIIVTCAGLYWGTGVSGGETRLEMVLEALDYSVATFTGIERGEDLAPPHSARLIVFFEAFAGILFSVLLGYVLGTREAP